jgi:hypothetical protein
MFALFMGMIVYFLLVPSRLRQFGFLILLLTPAVLVAWWSSGQKALMENRADMSLRIESAANLRTWLLATLIVVSVLFAGIMFAGKKIVVPKSVSRITGLAVISGLVLTLVVGSILFLASKPDIFDYAADTYHSFSAEKTTNVGAGRLLEVGSAQRWWIWEEAISNWESHPVIGTGAQSFPLVHLMLREQGTPYVKQAHGLPFSLLTELGLVGFIIGLAFICALMVIVTRNWCRLASPGDRALSGTIISLLVIYLFHTAYDWDWNVFALTMAFFYFAGIAIGWQGRRLSDPARKSP